MTTATATRHVGCIGSGCPHCAKFATDPNRYAGVVASLSPERHGRDRRPCIHLGEPTGESIECKPCSRDGKRVRLKVLRCAVHGRCTPETLVKGHACCRTCIDRTPARPPDLLPGLPDPLPITDMPRMGDWHIRPDVRARHVSALHRLKTLAMPDPAQATGSGIVYVGGGKYWPMLTVAVRMARDVCQLPIQIWHRGNAEPVDISDIADVPGVRVIDATTYPHRKLGGWECKSLALLYCGFERVLFLDADAYPVSDPAPFLDLATPERPFVFWSDQPNHDTGTNWPMVGIDAEAGQRVPCVQGGQLAIHRAAFWRELVVNYWLNQHSEYTYRVGYGDQDQWRVALALTGRGYHHLGRAPFRSPAFICPVADRPVIVHRPRGKGPPFDDRGFGSREARHLPGEARAFEHHQRFAVGSSVDAEAVFSRVYRYGLWGHGDNSGGGSTAAEAGPYVELVNGLARVAGWRRVVDLACGDGSITRQLDTPGRSEIIGVDVYEPHLARLRTEHPYAQWLTLDLDRDRDQLPTGDVAYLKDVLHHWPNALIRDWLVWASRAAKWDWLILTYDSDNPSPVDIPLGGYRALRRDLEPLWGTFPNSSWLWRLTTYLHKTVAVVDCRTR